MNSAGDRTNDDWLVANGIQSVQLSGHSQLNKSVSCVAQEVRDDFFLLCVESGELLVLDLQAGAFWKRLVGGDSIAEAIADIAETSLDDAVRLASQLVQAGVLTPCPPEVARSFVRTTPRSDERGNARTHDAGRVAILYLESAWPSSYSVAHVVLQQCVTLSRHGFAVRLIAPVNCPRPALSVAFEFNPVLPDFDQAGEARTSLRETARTIADRLEAALMDCEVVLTHDLALLEQYLAHNLAVRMLAARAPLHWLHWMHSTPRLRPAPMPSFPQELLFQPIERSRYVCVSSQHRAQAAEMLAIAIERVEVVANTRLTEGFFGSPLLWSVAERHGLLDASIVSIFPTRLNRIAKQSEYALYILRSLKALGHTVRLVFATPDGGTDAERTRIMQLRWLGERIGLSAEEVIFLVDDHESLRAECPNTLVRDLLLLSNVFIHPSAAEAHSLTLLEAACMKNLCVLNADVPSFTDVAGERAIWLHCGALGTEGVDAARIERALSRHAGGERPSPGACLYERLIILYGISPDDCGFYPLHARYYHEHRHEFDRCAFEISSQLATNPVLALHQRVRQRYSAARIARRELLPLIRAALADVRDIRPL